MAIPCVFVAYVLFTVNRLTKLNTTKKTKGNDFKMLLIITFLLLSLLAKEIEIIIKLIGGLYPDFQEKHYGRIE